MSNQRALLNQIAHFDNLYSAFKECSKGKRQKAGYQNFIFNHGEKLKEIESELLETHSFKWGKYREFEVSDPKKRTIMAAPFRDRVLHTAIHRVISPIVDQTLGGRTYACRANMGNRNAVIRLQKQLQLLKEERYCIKLDVKQYFAHINHSILADQLDSILQDKSISTLLETLIASHVKYRDLNRGIPIGNLTSQLFANLYLSKVDQLACHLLDIDFYDRDLDQRNFYIRYMDDMVIITQDKKRAFDCANTLIQFTQSQLKLTIPNNKKVILAKDPIPFLGFVLTTDSYRVLSRNNRKFLKKIKRMQKSKSCLSAQAMVEESYNAWKQL